MNDNPKPWWAPDAQGFLAGAIVLITGAALFIRMFHTSAQEDKMLDTMITILFSTCLVTVYQYTFGSSRGSTAKDETLNKIAMMPAAVVPAVVNSSTTTTVEPGKTVTEVVPQNSTEVVPPTEPKVAS